MNRKYRLFGLIISFVVVSLMVSNPSETSYLNRVSNDYSKYHIMRDIPVEALQKAGKSKRSNYLVFSTYNYEFGRLQVFYFGVANRVYFVAIKRKKKVRHPVKVV